jgi:hypothetical protein
MAERINDRDLERLIDGRLKPVNWDDTARWLAKDLRDARQTIDRLTMEVVEMEEKKK